MLGNERLGMAMRTFGITIMALLLVCPTLAQAQAQPTPVITAQVSVTENTMQGTLSRSAMQAEHELWEREAAQRIAEHQAGAAILMRIARNMRNERATLIRRGSEITAHGRALAANRDTATLDAEHLRMRAANASAGQAHAALMAAIGNLETLAKRDDATNAAENAVR
jgi:hypothetical protein